MISNNSKIIVGNDENKEERIMNGIRISSCCSSQVKVK